MRLRAGRKPGRTVTVQRGGSDSGSESPGAEAGGGVGGGGGGHHSSSPWPPAELKLSAGGRRERRADQQHARLATLSSRLAVHFGSAQLWRYLKE